VDSRIVLSTPRLLVRPYAPEDANAYLDLCLANKTHLARFEWGNPALNVHTLADAAELLTWFGRQWAEDTNFFFGAWRKDDAALVAQVVLMPRNPDLPEYEVGYFVDHRHSGHGYVTEAARAVVDYAFETLGAWRVSARCSEENPPSQHVLKRCGFTLEGVLRDCNPYVRRPDGTPTSACVYGMVRGEWEEQHPPA
jgi:RimJ/RimL family protein N-acetyltransferase